jgi:ABC-type multidrug transport system fused ATPase/permease subunit
MSSHPAPPVPKLEGLAHLYRELWRSIVDQRRTFIGAVMLLVAAQLTLLAIPYASAHAINALQLEGRAGLREAGLWLLAVLAITAGSWLMHGPGRILERTVALTIRRRTSATLVERLLQVPLDWHQAHHSGATAHRVQQSTRALAGFAESQFIYLNSAVRLAGPLAALWLIAPAVGCAALAGFAVISASVISFDRAMLRLARAENAAERTNTGT